MTRPLLGVYVIGQSPRPDLTDELIRRFPGTELVVRGALDGMSAIDIPPTSEEGFPLETTMADGTRVEIDASALEPLLQRHIDALDGGAVAHVVLCAGPFPTLRSRRPLIRPFGASAEALNKDARKHLLVVVPFEAQAEPARRKWEREGFTVDVVAVAFGDEADIEGLSRIAADCRAEAVVLDYVGVPPAVLERFRVGLQKPVYDLGEVALGALGSLLTESKTAPRL